MGPVDSLIRLLLVEPDAQAGVETVQLLEKAFGNGCVTVLDRVKAALECDPRRFDLALVSLVLIDGSGFAVMERLLAGRPDLPVVMLAPDDDPESLRQAIRRGAYDYVLRTGGYIRALPLIVEKNLAIWRTKQDNVRLQDQLTETLRQLRTKNRQLEEAVGKLATVAATDPLTGLANRRAFNLAADRAFADARRRGEPLACIMIDLDHFKAFNDRHGHPCGDEALRVLAQTLQGACRQTDVPARYGGDEFVVLLPHTDHHRAREVAHRIRDAFVQRLEGLEQRLGHAAGVTLSMGAACLNDVTRGEPFELVSRADHALYAAKQAGKNRIIVYETATGQNQSFAWDRRQHGPATQAGAVWPFGSDEFKAPGAVRADTG